MEKLFEILGLSKAQTKVFYSLQNLGPSTTGQISKDSGVPTSHIYKELEGLIEKGLVGYYISKSKKHYEASPPKKLKELYEAKKKELEAYEEEVNEKVKELESISPENVAKSDIRVYEGIQGIKTAIEGMVDSLSRGETYYVMGAPKILNERLNAFFKKVHKERTKKGIKFKIIYNKSAEEYAKERSNSKFTEAKVLDIDTPTELCFYKGVAQIIVFSEKPTAIEIQNKDLVKSFEEYFNKLWKQSKSIK